MLKLIYRIFFLLFSNSLDLNKERKLALNLFTGILFRQMSWCIIIGFSRNILIIAELLYCDSIVIVSHVSWLYRIVRYPAIPTPSVLWAKGHLKWTVLKWKSVLWSDESKFDILVGNHRCLVLRAKEEGDLPACYQHSVQKPASMMVWGCISAYGMSSLHVLEGTMNVKVYKGFRATYAPLQTMCISAGQCKTTYYSFYNSMAS